MRGKQKLVALRRRAERAEREADWLREALGEALERARKLGKRAEGREALARRVEALEARLEAGSSERLEVAERDRERLRGEVRELKVTVKKRDELFDALWKRYVKITGGGPEAFEAVLREAGVDVRLYLSRHGNAEGRYAGLLERKRRMKERRRGDA